MSGHGLRVLLVGATGLVGRHCLEQLREDSRVAQVTVLQRSAQDASSPAARECVVRVDVVRVDFEEIDSLPDSNFAVDVAICALGTTIRRAGSESAFRRVDHDYVLAIAQRLRAAGATGFGLVSALGADARSRVFYNRIKGEIEADVAALGFNSLTIVRPSLLLGERNEFRLGERLSAPLGRWLPRRWRAVQAQRVALTLVTSVLRRESGIHHIENAMLFDAI